jgi:hypothetical protein
MKIGNVSLKESSNQSGVSNKNQREVGLNNVEDKLSSILRLFSGGN